MIASPLLAKAGIDPEEIALSVAAEIATLRRARRSAAVDGAA